jgi:hypothetical protein
MPVVHGVSDQIHSSILCGFTKFTAVVIKRALRFPWLDARHTRVKEHLWTRRLREYGVGKAAKSGHPAFEMRVGSAMNN